MDANGEEPLNLTVKKMPIAIVAPFSRVVDSVNNNKVDDVVKSEDLPEDLSVKKPPADEGMDLTKNNLNRTEQLRKYLCKNNPGSFYEKNTYNETNNKERQSHAFLDSKLLSMWYMNTIFNQQYINPTQFEKPDTSRRSNKILNNLLDKKPHVTYEFPTGFDALIRNEMQTTDKDKADVNGSQLDSKNNLDGGGGKNSQESNEKKKPHIKKPLNAFMLYMKEMRAKVVAECTLKESAAINQILGRRWHALGREEQAKYYELARRERQLHMQLYPDWSSRANATRGKKRKRKQDPAADGGNSMKKCRARYGLDQQSQWCKPCRRKKKCIRYLEPGDSGNQSDDNLGSCGSMGEEAHTPPDDDTESLNNRSMSSPLSSLTSPGGIVLPSPSTSAASPSVSVASPYMLQSPLTPHESAFDVKLPIPPPPHSVATSHCGPPPSVAGVANRNPVGTNPHDANNPLSVNQLTGQCVRNEPQDSGGGGNKEAATARSIISVT
ncbi:unnamed protein product [Callosobruchus maculatus]|uniref:dTCF n=1 Tax=Callosobruchus maculatus TaxID=64391 RepID=A0A653D352_CALMS|nr:unnamed protein product [Callosobruchus maculatus]